MGLLVVQLAETSVIDPSEPRVAVELPLVRNLSSVAVNVVGVVPAAGQLLGAARVISPDFVGTWKLPCSAVTCSAAQDFAIAIAEAFMLLITPFFC